MDEQLHFPLHTVELDDPSSQWRHSAISIHLYDCLKGTTDCRAYLGGFDVDIERILKAHPDLQAEPPRRILRTESPLIYLGTETNCIVGLSVWFEPGLF